MRRVLLASRIILLLGLCVLPQTLGVPLRSLIPKPSKKAAHASPPVATSVMLDKVADFVKAATSNVTEEVWMNEILKHLKTLRLVKANNEWEVPALAAHEPALFRRVKMAKFVDRIKGCSAQNPYIMKFLNDPETALGPKFTTLSGKVFDASGNPTQEAKDVITEVMAYFVVQDRLTTLLRNDAELYTNVFGYMIEVRRRNPMNDQSTFERLKILTMDAVYKKYVELFNDQAPVPGTWGRFKLVANILEATGDDFFKGYTGNARAGWSLLANAPGLNHEDPTTGAGPTKFAGPPFKPKSAVLRFPPFPERWADLYSTWNLAFTAKYSNWPFFFAKLMNPAVFCYHGGAGQVEPAMYIFSRSVGLLVHIQHEYMKRYDRAAGQARVPEDPVQWTDEHLVTVWGRNNAASAKEYESLIQAVTPTLIEKAQAGWDDLVAKAGQNVNGVKRWFDKPLGEKVSDIKETTVAIVGSVANFVKSIVFRGA